MEPPKARPPARSLTSRSEIPRHPFPLMAPHPAPPFSCSPPWTAPSVAGPPEGTPPHRESQFAAPRPGPPTPAYRSPAIPPAPFLNPPAQPPPPPPPLSTHTLH